MKVKELLEKLKDVDPESLVIVNADHGQCDMEAGGMSVMAFFKDGYMDSYVKYLPEDGENMGPEDVAQPGEDWVPCVVLWA